MPGKTVAEPKPGDLVIDASSLKEDLITVPPGELAGIRTEQDGYDDAEVEMVSNQEEFGEMAGIPDSDITELVGLTVKIKRLRAYRRALDRLSQIVSESERFHDNRRHQIISSSAGAVDKRSRRAGYRVLLKKYEKTRSYRSAAAAKAVRTRQRKKKAPETKGVAPSQVASPVTPQRPEAA
ncbi:MAG TPA: hypothetical protein VH877_03555 [Polyangia bacterium]|jgi:hypothetical protein|nr:hypothetical protein [Polyangia bacterium]